MILLRQGLGGELGDVLGGLDPGFLFVYCEEGGGYVVVVAVEAD